MNQVYEKNVFKSYRAVTKIHLGFLNDSLYKDEVVLFDGSTMKRGDKEHSLPSLQGAVKLGWLVLEGVATGEYRPQPADVKIGDAVNRSEKRNMRTTGVVVQHDEQDLGELSDIRGDKALPVHDSKNAGQVKKVASSEPNDDAVVVGRFKTSAKADPVEIGKDDRRVVQKLDNQTAVRIALPTGDVETAIAGDDLAELLPHATAAAKPAPGIAGEGRGDESELRARAVVASGSTRAGHYRIPNKHLSDAVLEAILTEKADVISDKDAEIARLNATVERLNSEVELMMKNEHPIQVAAEPTLETTPLAIQSAKLEVVQALLPGFEWDFTGAWLVRAKRAVDNYKDKPEYLKGVLAIEIPVVQKQIIKWTSKV